MKKICLIIGAAVLFNCAARAELIAYEPFQYKEGNGESLEGEGTGFGWAGGWTLSVPPGYVPKNQPPNYAIFTRHSNYANGVPLYGFNYADTNGLALPVRGKVYAWLRTAHRWQDGFWDGFPASRLFAQPHEVPVGGSIWFSILAMQNSSAESTTARNYIQLNPAQGLWQIVGCPDASSGSLAILQWGILDRSGKETSAFAPAVQSGQPMFLLVRVTITSPTVCSVSLWVNPNDMSSVTALGSPHAQRAAIPTTNKIFTGLTFHTDIRRSFSFDEIRVGTELYDVTRRDPFGPTLFIMK